MPPKYTGKELCLFASCVFNQYTVTEKEREFGCWKRQLADATTLENMKILKLQNTSKFQIKYNKCILNTHF